MAVDTPLDTLTAGIFRRLALVRGARALHPRGVTASGGLSIDGGAGTGAPFLDEPGSYPARIRFSKAAGTPGPLPDALGLAVRVYGAGGSGDDEAQDDDGRDDDTDDDGRGAADLLFTSSTRAPVLRHLPLPTWRWLGTFGSLLPFRTDHGRYLLALRGRPAAMSPSRAVRTPSLAALRAALGSGPLAFDLLVAPVPAIGWPVPPGHGWHPVGLLHVAEGIEDDDPALRFRPAREPEGMTLAPALRSWREAAYLGSERGHP